jgi:hypothetical protein
MAAASGIFHVGGKKMNRGVQAAPAAGTAAEVVDVEVMEVRLAEAGGGRHGSARAGLGPQHRQGGRHEGV